ncbi:hypothetical protein AAZX31_16G040100 [Glycine max]
MKRNMHLYTDFFFFSMFKDDTIISTSFRKRRLKLRFIPMINECILIAFFLCFPQISLSQPLRFPPYFSSHERRNKSTKNQDRSMHHYYIRWKKPKGTTIKVHFSASIKPQ